MTFQRPLISPPPRFPLHRLAHLSTVAALTAGIFGSLVLTGCASPGPQQSALAAVQPADLGLAPEGSQNPSDAVPARWWTTFGDDRLSALVDRTLADHPSLQAAQARAARAVAVSSALRGEDGPQVGLNADATRQHYTRNGLVPAPVAGHTWDSANITLGLSWELDLWGRQRAALAAAAGQERATQADGAAVRQALATQVLRGWVNLARLVDQREVARRTLAQREEMLGLIRQRVQAGLDTRVELRQAEAALPEQRSSLESLAEQIQLQRHQLALLSGQAPNALDGLEPRLADLKLDALPAGLSADLLGRRADVVAARWRVEAAGQDVAQARTRFYPDVKLSAFVGLSSLGLDRLLDFDSRTLGAGPALRLPIFEGGQLRAQLRGREAERDAAVAQYNQTVRDAVREVADALTSLSALQRQQAEQAQAQAGVESAWTLAQQRFGAGLGNYLLVLNAESQLLAQRRLAVELAARSLDNQAQLMRSLGGGWSESDAAGSPSGPASGRPMAQVDAAAH